MAAVKTSVQPRVATNTQGKERRDVKNAKIFFMPAPIAIDYYDAPLRRLASGEIHRSVFLLTN